MKRISDYTGLLESEGYVIRRCLQKWNPTDFSLSEKEYENDLLAHLKRNLPEVPVIPQYGIAKGRADIVVQDEHVIELKLGFAEDDIAGFDRCLGQLWRYRKKWVQPNPDNRRVWLVIVGSSAPEYRDLINTWFKEANNEYHTISPYEWVEKTPSNKTFP